MHSQIEDLFDEDGIRLLQRVIEYFSKSNNNLNDCGTRLRSTMTGSSVRQNLGWIPNDAGLFIYTDGTAGNTLFHFADLGASFIMANHVKPGDFAAGLDELTEEAHQLARDLVKFSGECVAIMIGRRICLAQDQVELRSAAELGDVRIPFFMVPVRSPTEVDATTQTADEAP